MRKLFLALDVDFSELAQRAKTFLKSSHRLLYCDECKHYDDCLKHHVFVEKKDDEPFKQFRESNGQCKELQQKEE